MFGSATTDIGFDGKPFGSDSDVDLLVRFDKVVYNDNHAGYYYNWDKPSEELKTVLQRKADLVPATSHSRKIVDKSLA